MHRPPRPRIARALAMLAGFMGFSGAGAPVRGQDGPEPASPPAAAPALVESETLARQVPEDLSGRGLIAIRDPFPLAVLHLQLPSDTLEVLEEGKGTLDVQFNWANNFALEDSFLVDAETYRLDLGGWYALRNDFYVGANLPIHARNGGVLDPVVEGFHDLFHLSDGGRSTRPENDYEITIEDPGRPPRSLESKAGLGDFVLRSHWNVSPGERWLPAVAIDALVGLPTSTAGFGSSGVDLGIAFSFYKRVLSPLYLYAVVGGAYLTDPKTEGIRFEKRNTNISLGYELALTRRLSLIGQFMNYSPLLSAPSPLDKARSYIAVGFKWEFVPECTLDLSLVENLYPFSNSADIALATGFSLRF